MSAITNVKAMFSGKKFIIILLLLAIFIGAAFYVYNTYVAPKLNPKFVSNREFTENEPVDIAEIFLIYANWCPHSKKVLPIWEELTNQYDGKVVKTQSIMFRKFDGDSQEKEVDDFSARYNKKIDGYPTIILVKQNQVIEFDANPTKENLEEFLKKTL